MAFIGSAGPGLVGRSFGLFDHGFEINDSSFDGSFNASACQGSADAAVGHFPVGESRLNGGVDDGGHGKPHEDGGDLLFDALDGAGVEGFDGEGFLHFAEEGFDAPAFSVEVEYVLGLEAVPGEEGGENDDGFAALMLARTSGWGIATQEADGGGLVLADGDVDHGRFCARGEEFADFRPGPGLGRGHAHDQINAAPDSISQQPARGITTIHDQHIPAADLGHQRFVGGPFATALGQQFPVQGQTTQHIDRHHHQRSRIMRTQPCGHLGAIQIPQRRRAAGAYQAGAIDGHESPLRMMAVAAGDQRFQIRHKTMQHLAKRLRQDLSARDTEPTGRWDLLPCEHLADGISKFGEDLAVIRLATGPDQQEHGKDHGSWRPDTISPECLGEVANSAGEVCEEFTGMESAHEARRPDLKALSIPILCPVVSEWHWPAR